MSPARSSVRPSTHTFRVRLLGGFSAPPDARQIWRELELTGDQTLSDLGEAIPLAFGFHDLHMWSFFLSGKPWDAATEYTRWRGRAGRRQAGRQPKRGSPRC
jgi:Plasmid pRiA4b ORF-3-like protein